MLLPQAAVSKATRVSVRAGLATRPPHSAGRALRLCPAGARGLLDVTALVHPWVACGCGRKQPGMLAGSGVLAGRAAHVTTVGAFSSLIGR